MQSVIKSRFYGKLANKPYCSLEKRADLIRSKASAFKYPYIQPNPPHLAAWLIFDCDHSEIHLFEDVNLPVPNMICYDSDSLRHHVYYAIQDVYTTDKARRKPLEWLAAIERTFQFHLKADTQYVGLIAKNPFHQDWCSWFIHGHVYELCELADAKDLLPKPIEQPSTGYGRNCELFDQLRYWSYRNVHKYGSNELSEAILQRAEQLNVFAPPLPYTEVKSIARSVTKYCEQRRSYFTDKYGRKIGLNPSLDLKTRQSLGASYTATAKSGSTQAKIKAAKDMLIEKHGKATQKGVQSVTGLGIATIKRHWKSC